MRRTKKAPRLGGERSLVYYCYGCEYGAKIADYFKMCKFRVAFISALAVVSSISFRIIY